MIPSSNDTNAGDSSTVNNAYPQYVYRRVEAIWIAVTLKRQFMGWEAKGGS
jgi:hypothetical protein